MCTVANAEVVFTAEDGTAAEQTETKKKKKEVKDYNIVA